jgi:hypothetical protein
MAVVKSLSLLQSLLVVAIAASSASAAPDTLVVCPAEFRAALAPWENFRRNQGHMLAVIEPPPAADQLQAEVRQFASAGRLKFVVLVGDVDVVPTGYADATVNVRWGSEPTIASDSLFSDIDGDQVPDVAVGRIPADSPDELSAVVHKLVRYERGQDRGAWRRRLNVVAGVGGFGPLTDALIEAAGRSVFEQVVPANYEVVQSAASPMHACEQLNQGCFAWIYLGHGLPTELDRIDTPRGPRPILSVADVPRLRCGGRSLLAVLVACYTGAIDARRDCLAEELAVCDEGPVAVIAATRVTMPYGNSVLGCELLRAGCADRAPTLGELWLAAQRRTLESPAPDDSLRGSLDALARGVSPPPVDLAGERREHVLMYQLLGDPLLRMDYPPQATPRIATAAGQRALK